jgi:putative transcriptional regulator
LGWVWCQPLRNADVVSELANERWLHASDTDAMNNLVRDLRAERGWSQAELAQQLDVSRQTINAIETGKYDPSLPLAFKIARLFGMPIEMIFVPEGE